MADSMTELTLSERQGAAAAHASGIFLPFIGPASAYLIGGKSRYVRYHALHALVGMLLLNAFLFTAGAISIGFSVYNLWRHYQEDFQNFEWWPIILKSAITWIVILLIGLANTVANAIQAYRAYHGRWPGKSLSTAIVNRLLPNRMAVEGSLSD